jgi:hypothetical protein
MNELKAHSLSKKIRSMRTSPGNLPVRFDGGRELMFGARPRNEVPREKKARQGY